MWAQTLQRYGGISLPLRAVPLRMGHNWEYFRAVGDCRHDLAMSYNMLEPYWLQSLNMLTWGSSYPVIVVPRGLGRGRHAVRRLVDPFTAPMWLATAASALAAGVSLWLLGRSPRPALQCLAPLLAQPPPERTTRRPLLGAWLLVTVVVSAAYQGQLLSVLTVPDPAREIGSLEEVAENNLTMVVRGDLYHHLHWQQDLRIALRFSSLSLPEIISDVGRRRVEATVVDLDWVPSLGLDGNQRVHVFRVPSYRFLRARLCATKGSPLERPMRKVLGRMFAAGLDYVWSRRPLGSPGALADAATGALSWSHVQPLVAVCSVGLLAAAIAFFGEVAASARCPPAALRDRGPRPTPEVFYEVNGTPSEADVGSGVVTLFFKKSSP
ncbi:hypothetical protein ONE63_005008 [Megalurothrips usitatus]|uniref:Uncharacterized protein n=1 Tax=Megalurothrips usitatus TaxID=439358 RepID=A0AAV7X521_9NEOP|nr:hypothetical protein ONE63_005008 [Megalurothrips usitatus]